jgi:hypothetical protein
MDSAGKAISMRTLYPEDLEEAYAIEVAGLFSLFFTFILQSMSAI